MIHFIDYIFDKILKYHKIIKTYNANSLFIAIYFQIKLT